MHSATDYRFDEIEGNSEFSHLYKIDETAYEALLNVFQDKSPIHVDEEYAKSAGFAERVMHGAILQGFLSNFVGMHFPGKRSLILSVNINYHRPSYLGDEIRLTAQVKQKVETGQVVVMNVRFENITSGLLVASGKVQIAIRNE